jgi:hypothetical protein
VPPDETTNALLASLLGTPSLDMYRHSLNNEFLGSRTQTWFTNRHTGNVRILPSPEYQSCRRALRVRSVPDRSILWPGLVAHRHSMCSLPLAFFFVVVVVMIIVIPVAFPT